MVLHSSRNSMTNFRNVFKNPCLLEFLFLRVAFSKTSAARWSMTAAKQMGICTSADTFTEVSTEQNDEFFWWGIVDQRGWNRLCSFSTFHLLSHGQTMVSNNVAFQIAKIGMGSYARNCLRKKKFHSATWALSCSLHQCSEAESFVLQRDVLYTYGYYLVNIVHSQRKTQHSRRKNIHTTTYVQDC